MVSRRTRSVPRGWAAAPSTRSIQLFLSISQWRLYAKPGDSIHGVITHGGDVPNIVPPETAARFLIRSARDEDLDELLERFEQMAQAAALATGCTVEVLEGSANRCRTMWNNPVLAEPLAATSRGRRRFRRAPTAGPRLIRHGQCQPGGPDHPSISRLSPRPGPRSTPQGSPASASELRPMRRSGSRSGPLPPP